MDDDAKNQLMQELERMEEHEREDQRTRQAERAKLMDDRQATSQATRRLALAKEAELRALATTAGLEAAVVRARRERGEADEVLAHVRRDARVRLELARQAEARAATALALVEADTTQMQATIDQALLSYRIAKLAEIDEVREEADHLLAELARDEVEWTADDRAARVEISELEATVKDLVGQTTQLERALTTQQTAG